MYGSPSRLPYGELAATIRRRTKMIRKLLATNNDVLPLILRLTLGLVMFPHGAQKMLGWFGGAGFSATMQGMTGMGLPGVIVFLVIVAEFFGALGLITGFLTRFSAFGIAMVMLGAVATVHAKFGFFMNWFGQQQGEGFEYHLLVIGMSLALLVVGGGKWALDGVVARWLGERATSPAPKTREASYALRMF
jgi:putative oxidoreductase